MAAPLLTPVTVDAAKASGAAAVVATLLAVFGPHGVDLAAHVYQRSLFVAHGFAVWDNLWYAGRYSFVHYSVLFYPVAAVFGVVGTGILSIALATYAFAVVVGRAWGRPARWSIRSFALVWPGLVLSGELPFALGAALALLAAVALQRNRHRPFLALALLSLAASPLAFAFLVLGLAGVGALRRRGGPRLAPAVVVGIAVISLGELVLWRLFPDGARYPFSLADLIGVCVFCGVMIALTWRRRELAAVAWGFAAYGVASLVTYVVPTSIGGNIDRLQLLAVPVAVLVLAVRGWRPVWLAAGVLVLACYWNSLPLVASWATAAGDSSAKAAYWQPAVDFVHDHLDPSYRVEVLDTAAHWAAFYFPRAGIPLARGWYRQNDFPTNAVLYNDELSRTAYLAWLQNLGVQYVVAPDVPLDYSAVLEGQLVASGRLGLTPAFHSEHVTVYSVPGPRPIVSGPGTASVSSISPTGLVLDVGSPGYYRVAVHGSPYWHSPDACVSTGDDGMMRLLVPTTGTVRVQFQLEVGTALRVLVGASPTRCPPIGGP